MDEGKGKHSMTPKEGTPQKIAETNPQLSAGDFSYLEIIMSMQNTMGKLTEAVESLKTQSTDHGNELKQIGKDVHAAKVVGAVLAAVGGLLGWVLHEISPFLSHLIH
jgi:hypothetical protein